MTRLDASTRTKRFGALLMAACLVVIWLLGARAVLSTSIYSAQHACCHEQKLGNCLTLCAAANWTATASVEHVSPVPAFDVLWVETLPPAMISARADVTVQAVNHSPPLYLQHSALRI